MTPDNKVPSGNTPLDLDRWEADAKENKYWSPHELHSRILALVSELRQARELQTKLIQMLKDREAERVIKLSPQEWQKLEERLKSAEKALSSLFSDFKKTVDVSIDFNTLGSETALSTIISASSLNKVRAHFEKYASDEGEKS